MADSNQYQGPGLTTRAENPDPPSTTVQATSGPRQQPRHANAGSRGNQGPPEPQRATEDGPRGSFVGDLTVHINQTLPPMMVEGSACVQNGARGLGDLARYPCNCPADELADAWSHGQSILLKYWTQVGRSGLDYRTGRLFIVNYRVPSET